ncbi:conserved hypothetical protein [Desulfosarcina cetonica]|uniref:nucleoside triphosphate pyrophosphohydrolase n=1 Tax=Desulfosarcina cetonica TaxID=90730 RepID=UPI0006D002AC|nr:nucleoside triphosphate pyrophosphohydrolase [Desulfosarcina cetonica]VTR65378.1 conserved hypothetical protein [Desulfosarcina cetonica]
MAEDPITPSAASINRIIALIKTLMGEHGCPWDKKQTPETVCRYLLEEAHELVDAVVSKSHDAICEETGDVLFQIFFLIDLFTRQGAFGLDAVVETNVAKMVRRHPHVFGEDSAETPEKVSENWEKIKREEKKGAQRHDSILDSIPQGIPALLRAAMVSERAAKTGFDWDNLSDVMRKSVEEWGEFSQEIHSSDKPVNDEKVAEEFGDLLFTLVNVARFARIHPELALVKSIQKFENRFKFMENAARQADLDFKTLTFAEMHRLWDEAKSALG